MAMISEAPRGYAGERRLVRALETLARWLGIYSDAAVRIATFGVILGIVVAAAAAAANVFTRYVLGYSIQGSDELQAYSFLWVIWMGVSIAVRRGSVTQITFISDNGPPWWQRSVKTFSGLSLAALLVYACIRTTQYAGSSESLNSSSAGLGIAAFYPIVSMTIGYYFITLHYTRQLAGGAARVAGEGRAGLLHVASGLVGGLAITAVVWTVVALMLAAGVNPLVAIGVVFVALTLAGNPIIFMLSIVGIMATIELPGLSFYPVRDVIFPFRTTQNEMGLKGSAELVVILMFLVVAQVMNSSGMSDRLISFAGTCVGHLRGGMAYVCQVTSALVSGISGSAQADAAIMTPLLVPAMEKEGYPRDVAAAVVAGASIKGPIGPLSIMFIFYGIVVETNGAPISRLLLSGIMAEILLLFAQAATVYIVVRRMGFFHKRPFAGFRAVGRSGVAALPVLIVPFVILGGILSGVFTPTESGAAAVVVALGLALYWYASLAPRDLPRVLTLAGIDTGIVMLLVGDSAILAKVLQSNGFGDQLSSFFTGITDNKYVFLLLVNLLLLALGLFVEPLPALAIFAPFLADIAVGHFHVDPTQFGLIMVFNLVLALIHPPLGLVIFLVSSLARVSVERLSIMILPWLAVSLVVLFLVTYLPSQVVLALANLLQ